MAKKVDYVQWAKKHFKSDPFGIRSYGGSEFTATSRIKVMSNKDRRKMEIEQDLSQEDYKPKKVVFDLDGVIRLLYVEIEAKYGIITDYDWRSPEGDDMCSYIEKDLDILLRAPKSEYFDVIKKQENLEIWTYQLDHWKEITMKWIIDNIGSVDVKFYNPYEKYQKIYELDYFIVEDRPKFESFERFILIDRAYNQNVNPRFRVKNTEELERILNELKSKD